MDVDQREAARARALAAIDDIAAKYGRFGREMQTAAAHVGALHTRWRTEWPADVQVLGQALKDLGMRNEQDPGYHAGWQLGCTTMGNLDDWLGAVLTAAGLDLHRTHVVIPEPEWTTELERRVVSAVRQFRRAVDAQTAPPAAPKHWTFEEMISGRHRGAGVEDDPV